MVYVIRDFVMNPRALCTLLFMIGRRCKQVALGHRAATTSHDDPACSSSVTLTPGELFSTRSLGSSRCVGLTHYIGPSFSLLAVVFR